MIPEIYAIYNRLDLVKIELNIIFLFFTPRVI
jgi:hypothetical protein